MQSIKVTTMNVIWAEIFTLAMLQRNESCSGARALSTAILGLSGVPNALGAMELHERHVWLAGLMMPAGTGAPECLHRAGAALASYRRLSPGLHAGRDLQTVTDAGQRAVLLAMAKLSPMYDPTLCQVWCEVYLDLRWNEKERGPDEADRAEWAHDAVDTALAAWKVL